MFLKYWIESWIAFRLCSRTVSGPCGLQTKPWVVLGYSINVPRPLDFNTFSNSSRTSGVKAKSFSAHKNRIGRFTRLASSLTKNDGCAITANFIIDDNSGCDTILIITLPP